MYQSKQPEIILFHAQSSLVSRKVNLSCYHKFGSRRCNVFTHVDSMHIRLAERCTLEQGRL